MRCLCAGREGSNRYYNQVDLAAEVIEELNLPEGRVFAWGMSFPKAELEDSTVEYTVNSTWLRSIYGDDRDEDEIEDENE